MAVHWGGRGFGHTSRLLTSTSGITGGGTPTTPLYSEVVARPTPNGTVHTVTPATSAATIASIYAAMSPGDCLEFDDGTYSQPDCFPNGWNVGGTSGAPIVIRAKNRGAYDSDPMGGGSGAHHARFQRKVTFEYDGRLGGTTSVISADNIAIHDIHHTTVAGLWPADNANWVSICAAASTSPWGFLSLASGVSGCSLIYNEFSMGYGATKDQFDPTLKYPDCNSPATFTVGAGGAISSGGSLTGWGDATWLTYNRLLYAPYAVVAGGKAGTDFTIYGNYFHDVGHCLNGTVPAAGRYLEQHNWMERSYHDFGTLSRNDASAPDSIEVLQNVWIDPCGHKYDNGNPHVDCDQLFWSISGGGIARPRKVLSSRNLLMNTSALVRAPAQFNFFQLSASHYAVGGNDVIAIAPKLRENIAVMGGSTHAGDLGVSEDFYVRGNEVWHPVKLNDNALADNVQAGLVIESAYGISTARTNRGLIADNVLESALSSDSGTTIADAAKINNTLLGSRTARIVDESAVFTGSTAAWPGSTPYAAFQYRKKQAAYSTLGTQAANIVDFLMKPLDWTGERPFLGFVDSLGQTAGATITSNPAWVHGGDPGDTLAIVPGSGVQWQALSATDRTTVTQAWSSTSGTVTVDSEYVQLKVTAPTQGTQTNFSVTLGGIAQTWTVASTSTAAYPLVQLDGSTRFVRTSTAALGTDGQKVTIALEMLLPTVAAAGSYPSATLPIFGNISGTSVEVSLLTTGSIRVLLRNAAGTTICQWTSTADYRDGNKHRFLFSVDMSQTSATAGFKASVDGTTLSNAPSTFDVTGTQTIAYSKTGSNLYQLGGNGTLNVPAGTQFSFAYMDIAHALDATSGTVQTSFQADQIGNTGTGPTGTQPLVFLVGNAGQWNASTVHPTGSQWGSDIAWTATGGTATDVTGGQAAWS